MIFSYVLISWLVLFYKNKTLCWLAKIEGGHTRTIYLTNATVMMMDGFVKVEGTKSWNKLINDTVSIKCSLK